MQRSDSATLPTPERWPREGMAALRGYLVLAAVMVILRVLQTASG